MAVPQEPEAAARAQWLNKKILKTTSKDLLIIFARTPVKGKVKTRLAKDIGDEAAFNIYNFLLEHTSAVTRGLPVDKEVFYSDEIQLNDIWDNTIFRKKIQKGEDLGERMESAFSEGFRNGYKNIIIIGSDLYDISREDLENAFVRLKDHKYIIGPAEDGGYYLLGMKASNPTIFQNKKWGTSMVFSDTIKDLRGKDIIYLEYRNDVDVLGDIKDHKDFQQFLKEKI